MEDLHYNICSIFNGFLFEIGHKHHGLLIKHSSDAWELHALMCSGKLDLQYSLFSHLSLAVVFFRVISQSVGAFSSAQSDVYPGLNTDLSIDFQPHRKKGAAVQKYWVGLINTYWLCWLLFPGVQVCVQPAYEMRLSSVGVKIKSWNLAHLFWPG